MINETNMNAVRPWAVIVWIMLTAGCTLPGIRYPFASRDRVWFQKGVPQSTLAADLETCRSEGNDAYFVRRCMKAKGYLWLPRTEVELLQVRTLQVKGLKEQQIASELQWPRKKVNRYADERYRLGHIEALGRQPVDILVSLGKPAVPQLIKQLHVHDPLSRRQAAQALGEIGDARAVEALIGLLRDPDALIRRHAAKALGKIAAPEAVDPLIALLKDPGQEAHVKATAAEALGRIGQPRACVPLIRALDHANWAVRSRAAKALGKIADPEAVGPLIHVLNDPEATVRAYAAEALGQIKDVRAAGPLKAALKDPDANVSSRAREALKKIHEDPGRP